jgi:hypothetical protein
MHTPDTTEALFEYLRTLPDCSVVAGYDGTTDICIYVGDKSTYIGRRLKGKAAPQAQVDKLVQEKGDDCDMVFVYDDQQIYTEESFEEDPPIAEMADFLDILFGTDPEFAPPEQSVRMSVADLVDHLHDLMEEVARLRSRVAEWEQQDVVDEDELEEKEDAIADLETEVQRLTTFQQRDFPAVVRLLRESGHFDRTIVPEQHLAMRDFVAKHTTADRSSLHGLTVVLSKDRKLAGLCYFPEEASDQLTLFGDRQPVVSKTRTCRMFDRSGQPVIPMGPMLDFDVEFDWETYQRLLSDEG